MQNNIFIGRVAAEPKLSGKGDSAVCKFTLMETAYAGKDKSTGEARERTTAVQFTVFRGKAETIANHVRTGDQLAVNFRIENNKYDGGKGDVAYPFNFVVDDFEFCAPGKIKRDELENA